MHVVNPEEEKGRAAVENYLYDKSRTHRSYEV